MRTGSVIQCVLQTAGLLAGCPGVSFCSDWGRCGPGHGEGTGDVAGIDQEVGGGRAFSSVIIES